MRKTELKVLNEVINEIPELLVDGSGDVYENRNGRLLELEILELVQVLHIGRQKLITLAENAEADDQGSQSPQDGRSPKPRPSGSGKEKDAGKGRQGDADPEMRECPKNGEMLTFSYCQKKPCFAECEVWAAK